MKPQVLLYLFLHISFIKQTNCWSPSNADKSQREELHVWRAADRLSETMKDHPLTTDVVQILRYWGNNPNDDVHLQRILNKSNLLQEIEEATVALGLFIEWMETSSFFESNKKITLIDVCCGKGICSLLASYLFKNDTRISKILMMDKPNFTEKHNKGPADWAYIETINANAYTENRPKIETHQENLFESDKVMELLTCKDEQEEEVMALIGIHLCKNLSPAFIGLVNALGQDRVPFCCLAPCCLPRVVLQGDKKGKSSHTSARKSVINVAQYETPLQRQARLRALQNRRNAKQRHTSATRKCFLCQSTDHTVRQCRELSSYSASEQSKILNQAAALEPCWKCGELGHKKRDCPSQQISGLPAQISRPLTQLDVSQVMSMDNPFLTYCNLLGSAIDRKSVRVMEAGLQKTKSSTVDQRGNWNRHRKTIFIVASNQ